MTLRRPLVHSITKASLRTRRVEPKTSSSPSNPDASFPFFSKLPLELRLKIWKMTTEERRLIFIRTSQKSLGFNSPAPIPAALHVCSESRIAALKTYKLSFGSRIDGFRPKIFCSLNQDTLYFRGDQDGSLNIGVFGTGIKEEERDCIESLAVDINTGSPNVACQYVNLQQWNGLKDLHLCMEEPRLDLESNLKLRELKEMEQWGFVMDYRRMANYRPVPKSLRLSEAVEKIEKTHLGSHPVLNGILKKNSGEGGVSLAVVFGT